MKSEVADVLDAAAEVIEKRGWCNTGTGVGPDGELCMFWSVLAAGGRLHDDRATNGAVMALSDFLGGVGIAFWNDHNALDAADVINHLRKAAEAARSAP